MTETLPSPLLSSLSDFVATQMGLSFPSNRWVDLNRGFLAAARDFGFKEPEACVEWLLSSPLTKRQIETLASHLTVGETYFFREKQSFQALERQVLPELIRSRAAERRLRIWSAGCATGEEPYSLAILLAKMIPGLASWNISILGTDINPRTLQKASIGAFTMWSFRDCPKEISEKYFKRNDEGHREIRPEIRKMVTFSYLNLVEDIYPSLLNETNALDLIFCRNVLMYFASEQAKRVVQRFHRCLLEGSWLVVSATETSQVLYSQFSTVNFPGAVLYRKVSHPAHLFTLPALQEVDEPIPLPVASLEFVVRPDPGDTPTQGLLETGPPVVADLPTVEASQPQSADPFVEYEEGRYENAAEAAAALLSQEPDNVKAMVLLARILANQGQLAQALEWCDKAIATEKLDPALHYLRATILQEQGDAEEAASSLKRSLYLDRHFVLAHFALGNLHLSLRRPQEAERHFQNTLLLLKEYRQEELLPESEGITAGRLRETVERLTTFD